MVEDGITMKDVVLDPQEILAFYASDAQVYRGLKNYWPFRICITGVQYE